MSYCEASEVREMLKDDALNGIIGDSFLEDAEEKEKKILPIIINAISDADAEIDGYLAKRYPVPMNTTPKVISKFSKDIAVYNLYSRVGIDENEREKNYLTRYNAAISFLKLVAEGKIDLGVSSQQNTASTGFQVSSNNRLFSRGNLRGM